MFSICNRFTFVFVSLQLPTAHLSSVNAFESRIAIRNCLLAKNTHTFVGDVFLWIHGKWHKFAMSYIAIQSFVVGINVAIQNCSVGRCYFVRYFFCCFAFLSFRQRCFVISWASFHSCCALHMCDKHSTKQSTKTLFFSSLSLSLAVCVRVALSFFALHSPPLWYFGGIHFAGQFQRSHQRWHKTIK